MNHIEFLEKMHGLTFNRSAGFSALSDISELLEKHVSGALDDARDAQMRTLRLQNKAVNARRLQPVRRAQ